MAPGSQSSKDGLTLAIIGCGNLGSAILNGILSSLNSSSSDSEELPSRIPTKFICTVKSEKSASKLRNSFSSDNITVIANDNVSAVDSADVIILGCKPWLMDEVLSADGMYEALKGKLLISIIAGKTVTQLKSAIYGSRKIQDDHLRVVRTMPNVAASVGASCTMVALDPDSAMEEEDRVLVNWLFTRVGTVSLLDAKHIDTATALGGSGPAIFALVLEAAAFGGTYKGIPHDEALKMAAQAMKGAAELVLKGEHPAILRAKVTTPTGCTAYGLQVCEKAGVRGSITEAFVVATDRVAELGNPGKK